ncbi:MAG: L,D-transpeptidase family protein, partial [Chloroflexota bacterium]
MRKRWINFLVVISLFGLVGVPMIQVKAQGPTEYDPSACADDTAGKPLSDACQAMIEAFPRPNVKEINQDRYTLDKYSFWKVGPEPTNTYDAPNGGVTGQIPKGFNFVNAVNESVDGWIQILGGKWVNRKDAKLTKASYFVGVTLPDGLKHDFAWVLDKSGIYVSEYPGGPASSKAKRSLVRYERVNIFSVAKDDQGKEWYMIGPNQWVKQTFVAKVHLSEMPKDVSGHWVAVDLYEQTLVAYEDATPIFATLISSGLPHHETNEGLFKVWAQVDHDSMSGATGAPSAYALQLVPWVMYFDDSISLHGTYWHDLFGYRQSHGCVNMTISDAKYIF